MNTGANRRLAQWLVTWLIKHSTSHQLLWCIDSFVLRNPPLRQAPKRYLQSPKKYCLIKYIKMFFRFLSFISIIFLLSCNNKEELIEIVSINDHGDLTYKLSKQKSIIYYRTYSFIDDGTVDSLGIDLSESDWRRINASFFKNEINKLDNNENYIGVETNSIKFPEKYTLKTNSKILNLKYDYFWKNDVSKINKLKTQKLVNFLITCDSIIAEKKNKLKI
jgi:hypothetical protein